MLSSLFNIARGSSILFIGKGEQVDEYTCITVQHALVLEKRLDLLCRVYAEDDFLRQLDLAHTT